MHLVHCRAGDGQCGSGPQNWLRKVGSVFIDLHTQTCMNLAYFRPGGGQVLFWNPRGSGPQNWFRKAGSLSIDLHTQTCMNLAHFRPGDGQCGSGPQNWLRKAGSVSIDLHTQTCMNLAHFRPGGGQGLFWTPKLAPGIAKAALDLKIGSGRLVPFLLLCTYKHV
jgi:hypothetical protein